MPRCTHCSERHVIYADWAACRESRIIPDQLPADIVVGAFDLS